MDVYLLIFESSDHTGIIRVEGTYEQVADLVSKYMTEDGIERCFICKILNVVELKEIESEQKNEEA